MNWGKGIIIIYLLFVGLILYMVIKSSLVKSDLVSVDYYQDELKYQQKINANASVLSKKIQIRKDVDIYQIITPSCNEFSYDSLVCQVYFPSSIHSDKVMKFLCNSEKRIDISKFPRLPFVMKINIYSGGVLIAYRELQ